MNIFFGELWEVSQDSGFRIIPLNQSFHIRNYMATVSQSAKIILITVTEKKKKKKPILQVSTSFTIYLFQPKRKET